MKPSGVSVASWFWDRLRVDSPEVDQAQDDLKKQEALTGERSDSGSEKGPVTHNVLGFLWTLRGTHL